MTPTKLSAEEAKRIEAEAVTYALKAMGSHPDDEEARQQCAMNYSDGATAEALRALEREEALKWDLLDAFCNWLEKEKYCLTAGRGLPREFIESQKQTEGEGE